MTLKKENQDDELWYFSQPEQVKMVINLVLTTFITPLWPSQFGRFLCQTQ